MVISEHFRAFQHAFPGSLSPKQHRLENRAPQDLTVDCHVPINIAVNQGFSTISGPTKLILLVISSLTS